MYVGESQDARMKDLSGYKFCSENVGNTQCVFIHRNQELGMAVLFSDILFLRLFL
jgi:hypothetical protein